MDISILFDLIIGLLNAAIGIMGIYAHNILLRKYRRMESEYGALGETHRLLRQSAYLSCAFFMLCVVRGAFDLSNAFVAYFS